MDSEQIKNFIIVSDCGSFSKAEEKAHISKQALIKQINNLEEEIGTSLFDRRKKGVFLNEAGKVFYEGATKLLNLSDEVVKDTLDAVNQKKILRISQVEHQRLLSDVTDEFRKRYPDVEIVPVIHPNHAGEWRVANGVADVGETFYHENFSEQHPLLNFTPLKDFPYCAVMSPSHPLSLKKTLSLKEISPYPVVIFRQITDDDYRSEMQNVFSADKFEIREDVDNMISVTFDICRSDRILITHNPYIYHLEGVIIIPLDNGWSQTHGIIISSNPSKQALDYLELAKEIIKK